MNLMEYQGKELFKRAGIPVPRGRLAATPEAVAEFLEETPGEWVIKAQVLMGGRGKAGKIKMAAGASQGRAAAQEIMATPMPPNRQNPMGEPVNSLLVEERLAIAKEAYCCDHDRPRRAKAGHRRQPLWRNGDRRGRRAASRINRESFTSTRRSDIRLSSDASSHFRRSSIRAIAERFRSIAGALYDLFFRYGAKLVEINPLALTNDGRVVASDAKIELDDDALFRNPEFEEWRKALPLDEDELLAAQAGVGIRNFRRFPGNVGTLANGAGLAMATMDAVANAGGEVADFLDVGGGANAQRVRNCYELVVNNTGAKVFFINIFGGITRGDEVARGIVSAMDETASRKIPLVIRLTGTNEEEGRRILKAAGMTPVETMDEGAREAVRLSRGA